MDIEAIQKAAGERIRAIRECPLGLQMRPLAEHLAFDTTLPANECLTILWVAAEGRRAFHGISEQETSMRLQ
jgi:hypothetical protein